MSDNAQRWRVGSKVPINVYQGNRPVCQCHTAEDARRIVDACNATSPVLPIHQFVHGLNTRTRRRVHGKCFQCGVPWSAKRNTEFCPGAPK